MNFCGGCGAAHVPGAQFCPQCGRAYSLDAAAASSPAPNAGSWSGAQPTAANDEPFPEWAPIAAGVAVVVAPFISLIAALLMRSSETRPSRRSFLKNWAIASGAWLCTGFLIFIIVFATIASKSGVFDSGCKGGPDPFAIPTRFTQQSGSRQWTAIVPCIGGGTTTRPARPGEAPFGG